MPLNYAIPFFFAKHFLSDFSPGQLLFHTSVGWVSCGEPLFSLIAQKQLPIMHSVCPLNFA